MKQKSVLITGCSSGIGLAAARYLRDKGFRVYPTARKEGDVAMLKAEGFPAFRLDLNDEESVDKGFQAVLDASGGSLYALFNNGGYGQPGALEDIATPVLKAQFQTNLFGWHHLVRLALPVMRRQGEGRIVQNSSVLGFTALKFRGPYVSSKYAVEGYTDALRLELEGSGVFVSLVEPGPIKSRFRANAFAKFDRNVDVEASPHREIYKKVRNRLAKEENEAPFTLPPEAVAAKVCRALTDKRPAPRYYVTFPTHLLGALKRVLPTTFMDRILLKITADENK